MSRFRLKTQQMVHQVFSEAAAYWHQESSSSMLAYGFRHGVAHQLSCGVAAVAEQLLMDFAYCMARLALPSSGGGRPLAVDFRAIKIVSTLKQPAEFELWEDFFRTRVHLLEREQRADKVLMQLAIEHADNSPVTQGAEHWLATGNCDWLWLRRTHRPKHAAISDCIRVFDTGGSVLGMVCEGKRLLSWGGSRAQVWDLHSGEELCAYEEHSKTVDGVRLLSSELALSWSWDQTLQTWDLEEAETLRIYNGHTDLVTGLVPLSDTKMLSWSKDRTLRVWLLGEAESQAVLTGHETAIAGACGLSGNRVMSWERAASEKRFRIWDSNTGACLESRSGPSDGIFSVHPETNRVICFKDELLRVESLDGEELLRLEGHTDDLSFAVLLEDGRLLSGDWAGEMMLWNCDNGNLLQRFVGHAGSVGGAELLPDGRILSWDDNSLRLWDPESGAQIKTFDGHSGSVRTVKVLGNGRFISASFDGTLRLWKAGQPQKEAECEGHSQGIWGTMELSNERLLTWSEDGDLRIWSRSGQHLLRMQGHTDMVQGVRLLPDKRLLSWSGDGTIRLWDSDNGAVLGVLEGHTDYVLGTMMLDDFILLSWAFDGSLRTWDLRKNQALKAVDGGGGKIFGAVRLPDGRILYQAKDRLMRTWDTHSEVPLECWKLADFVEQHPELVQLYKARNKKLPDPTAVEGFHCARSTVVVEHEYERASWQGEGYWTSRHGVGETLVVTNDKNLVFLQLWRGNQRLGCEEIHELLNK